MDCLPRLISLSHSRVTALVASRQAMAALPGANNTRALWTMTP